MKVKAYRVLSSVTHVRHADIADSWRNLAEIHAAPQWLWPALVAQMIEGLADVPCWVREMPDEEAYMQLVLCNTQSELHALEEGKHAAESGMDLKAYAEALGKGYTTLHDKVKAWRVLTNTNVRIGDIADGWVRLSVIHAAPQWLWPAQCAGCPSRLIGTDYQARRLLYSPILLNNRPRKIHAR